MIRIGGLREQIVVKEGWNEEFEGLLNIPYRRQHLSELLNAKEQSNSECYIVKAYTRVGGPQDKTSPMSFT
jgi:hypothetical protein